MTACYKDGKFEVARQRERNKRPSDQHNDHRLCRVARAVNLNSNKQISDCQWTRGLQRKEITARERRHIAQEEAKQHTEKG